MLFFSHCLLEMNFFIINSIVIVVFIVIHFHPPSVKITMTDFKIKILIPITASKGGKEDIINNNKSQICNPLSLQ